MRSTIFLVSLVISSIFDAALVRPGTEVVLAVIIIMLMLLDFIEVIGKIEAQKADYANKTDAE